MNNKTKEDIKNAQRIILDNGWSTCQPMIWADGMCKIEAFALLKDFVLCYENGSNSEELITLYQNTKELIELWENNQKKIKDDLDKDHNMEHME